MLFIHIEQIENNKKIYKLEYLLHQKVKVARTCVMTIPEPTATLAQKLDDVECVLCDDSYPKKYKEYQIYKELRNGQASYTAIIN